MTENRNSERSDAVAPKLWDSDTALFRIALSGAGAFALAAALYGLSTNTFEAFARSILTAADVRECGAS